MTGAVVLAAGPGSRLGELGARMPKTMISVGGRPYIEHLVGRLLAAGLRPVAIAVHHHADMIYDHFDGHPYLPNLRFVHTGQLGTGSDLLECLDSLPADDFIVWNGDTIVELDVADLLRIRTQLSTGAVIVLTRRSDAPNKDAWYVDSASTVLASLEAVPPPAAPTTYAWRGSSTGILLLTKALLATFQAGRAPDLYTTILPSLISQQQLKAYDNGDRYFLDFGTPQNLARIDHGRVSSWIRYYD